MFILISSVIRTANKVQTVTMKAAQKYLLNHVSYLQILFKIYSIKNVSKR